MLLYLKVMQCNKQQSQHANPLIPEGLNYNRCSIKELHLLRCLCCTAYIDVLFYIFLFRVEFIQLALDQKPLNLGQGFPDFPPPEYVTKALAGIASGDNYLMHQYTRGFVSLLFVSGFVTYCVRCYIHPLYVASKLFSHPFYKVNLSWIINFKGNIY